MWEYKYLNASRELGLHPRILAVDTKFTSGITIMWDEAEDAPSGRLRDVWGLCGEGISQSG